MSEALWRAEYPFRSHWRTIQPHGARYHYLDEGQGTPLLMVHGNPTWSFYWRRLVRDLPDYRRVVPDHLGCGLSDKPRDYRYRLQDHIDNLVSLIDELDLQRITLFGHDWGGAIGLGAALARPERFARFVMFNTGAFPPPFFPWRIRICRTPFIGRLAVQGGNLFSRAALRMAVQRPDQLSPIARQGLLAPYDSWHNRIAVYQFVRDIPQSPRHPTWSTLAEIESGLSRFADRPCQLIWGMKDWCFRPSCIDRFLTHWPSANLLRLENAGHWVVEEAHDEIVSCVTQFLEPQTTAVDR